jgi:multidrug efflux pump subunit AcrB
MNSSTLTEWIGRHRRSLLFLLLLPVLAGIGAALSLPVALFPNIQFPRVRISLDAGDRPAQQMALQVTTPVDRPFLDPRLTDVRSTTAAVLRRFRRLSNGAPT